MTETETKWAARVEDWRASGETARAFCAGKDFSAGGLRYWSSRLRKGAVSGARSGAVRLARIVRSAAAPQAVETPIVIEVGQARIGVRRGFDTATLRTVLEVLGAGR
jgi:hypothetical protein